MIVHLASSTSVTYWKQERLVFQILEHDSIKMWSNLKGSQLSPIATYLSDNAYYVFVDLTDYVRANPTVAHLYFYSEEHAATYDVTITIAGLINPFKVLIPQHALSVALICPPSLMYCDGVNKLAAELFPDFQLWTIVGDAALRSDKRQIKDILGDFTLSISVGQRIDRRTFSTTPLVCGVRYAFVRWVSFTGVTRVHIFEVAKAKTSAADAYSLLPTDNEFVEIKGREDGFVLRLAGLDAYDTWYYADLITSSKVEVSMDGTNYDRVQVVSKNVTLPDGEAGTDGKLEIEVNWKRYDAVAM